MAYSGKNRKRFDSTSFFTSKRKLLYNLNENLIFISPDTHFKKQVVNSSSEPFTDSTFPPNENSLTYLNKNNEATKEITEEELASLRSFTWRRVKDIMGPNYFLYNKIEIEDINQGEIGNCYFLSALSAIAEFSERFDKIFISKKKSDNGAYSVRLNLQGVPEIVTIDDHFPTSKGQFAGATSGRNEIWVQVLEKAYAKVNQSYASTIAGLPGEALATLTEAPVVTHIHRRIPTDKKDNLWKTIIESDKRNYIMCTNTGNDENAKKMGLVPGHAYTLISAYEHEDIRLLKVRNPWGQFEWNGPFSDKSEMWAKYPNLKQIVDFKIKNDGIFYITFEDYLTYFPYTYICKYETGYTYNFRKVEQKDNTSMIGLKFSLEKPCGRICISLHQKQQRFYSKIVDNYKIQQARIILTRYNKGRYEFIGSDSNDVEKLHIEVESLPAGDYQVFTNVFWPYDAPCRYVVSTYAERDVILNKIEDGEVPSNYLIQILRNYMESQITRKTIDSTTFYSISVNDNKLGFFLLYLENESKDNLQVDVKSEYDKKCSLITTEYTRERRVVKGSDGKFNDSYMTVVPPKSKLLLVWSLNAHPYGSTISFSNLSFKRLNVNSHYYNTDFTQPIQDYYSFYIEKFLSGLYRDKMAENLLYSELDVEDLIILIFENKSQNNYKFGIKINEMENLEALHLKKFTFTVKPGAYYFIVLKKSSSVMQEKYNFNFEYSFRKI